MKTSQLHSEKPQFASSGLEGRSLRRTFLLAAAVISAVTLASSPVRAADNVLVNPGFETGDTTGWTTFGNAGVHNATQTYYNAGQCPADATAENINIFDGTSVGNVYGQFNAQVSYSWFQQTAATAGGSTWSASAWVYVSHEDMMAFPNAFWIEVAFLNSGGTVLGQYESFVVTNLYCANTNQFFPLDTWVHLDVTNQVQNGSVIATLPNGVMTAPSGTATVRYRTAFENVSYAGGSVYIDDCALNMLSGLVPPVVTNLVPNHLILSTSNELTYTIVSTNSVITNATVVAVTNTLTGSPVTITNRPGSGLTVAGLGTAVATVTMSLNSNTVYNVTASGTDGNGATGAAVASFDTIQPVLVWEAEDFNYNGGSWVTSITPDGGIFAYADQVGIPGIDEFDANPGNPSAPHYYRPSDGVSIQGAYEQDGNGAAIYREKFLAYFAANPGASTNGNTVDEEVGYNNAGDWLDYTRNFPAGNYNVYARYATSGSGRQAYFETVTSDPTQSNQTVVTNGTFSMTDNNWNVYQYVPLLDQFGNLVSVHLSGTQTVRAQVAAGGNPNENFYMIVPAVPPQTPVVSSIYPDGTHPFEATNYLTFTVSKGNGSSIPQGNVRLTLNGSDVTLALGLTGNTNSWTGSIPLLSNRIYSAVLTITNSTSLGISYALDFDTFSQANYMWEAEDWDFSGGGFIDDPVPTADSTVSGGLASGTLNADSYYYYPGGNGALGVAGVDYYFPPVSGETQQYRPFDQPGTQVCGDYLRDKFLAAQQQFSDPTIADFNIGYYAAGDWLNYTRHYPAGTFNVYGRMAGGAGPFNGTTLSLVTAGWGTDTQATNLLGSFSDASAAGWQTWHWVPMVDTNNNLVTVQFNGSTNTLKLTSGNNLNVNFLMLVPTTAPALPVRLTALKSAGQVTVSFTSQAGHLYTVEYTTSLVAPISWSALTVITGDGTTKTATDNPGPGARFYRVIIQ